MRSALLALLLVLFLVSYGWSQSKNSRQRTYSDHSVSWGRKPTGKQLALVEANCSKGNLNQVALRTGLASYPREARRKRIGGKVSVKVYINESGDVYYAVPIDGPKLLRATAASAASWSKFAPIEANGVPVKCAGLLVYTFNAP